MPSETLLLYAACALYGLSFAVTYLGRAHPPYRAILVTGVSGLACHGASLALRWARIDHGPFINLHEILSSNLWSLTLVFLVFVAVPGKYRPAARLIAPLPALLMLWLLATPARDTYLPATYDTPWLYFHVVTGKFFLGLLMLAAGLALYEAMAAGAAGTAPARTAIVSPSYRLLAFAFCCESLMLVFGAIWAQDAWGRYWAWDPLETWAFMTWLAVVFVLHWRLNHARRVIYAALVSACLVLAFVTFFGVPFISTAPHKGMI